jgi:hypothetical protein
MNTHKPPGATYAASTNSKSKNWSSRDINRSILPNMDTSWRKQHLGGIDNNDKYRGSDAQQGRSELSGFNDCHRNNRYDNRSNNSEDNDGEWIIAGKKKDKRNSEHTSGGGVGQRSKIHNKNSDINHHGYNRGSNHPRGFNKPTGAGSGNTKREW